MIEGILFHTLKGKFLTSNITKIDVSKILSLNIDEKVYKLNGTNYKCTLTINYKGDKTLDNIVKCKFNPNLNYKTVEIKNLYLTKLECEIEIYEIAMKKHRLKIFSKYILNKNF